MAISRQTDLLENAILSTMFPLSFQNPFETVYTIVSNKIIYNKKHSENADTSTSVTYDMWSWPSDKAKNA